MATRLMSVVPLTNESFTGTDPSEHRLLHPGWIAVRPVPTGAQRVPSGLFTLDARVPTSLRPARAVA